MINCSDSNLEDSMTFSNEDAAALNKLFNIWVGRNIPTYDKITTKLAYNPMRNLTFRTVQLGATELGVGGAYFAVNEFSNYKTIERAYSIEDFKEQAFDATCELAKEVGFTVEFQIRQMAQALAGRCDFHSVIPNLKVVELFTDSDGTPNLKYNAVVNIPYGLEPGEGFVGWVSYKFRFAVLF